MLDSLPLGQDRLRRPEVVVRYTFEDFERASRGEIHSVWNRSAIPVVPIEAAAPGDRQVIAARGPTQPNEPVINLDVLANLGSVESVVVSTVVKARRHLPDIKELLFTFGAPAPDGETLRNLTRLTAFFSRCGSGRPALNLAALPAEAMEKLALSRWACESLEPLLRMKNLRQLHVDLFRETLDAVAGMSELEYLRVIGPAKGWAKLRECRKLTEAHLIEVEMENLNRWNTWSELRKLTLAGRGLKSLAGLEKCTALQELSLINMRMSDLGPLKEVRPLRSLQLRMADAVDLHSVGAIAGLRNFTIDSSRRDGQPVRLASLKALSGCSGLEQVVLLDTLIEDGDLLPLAGFPQLKRVKLGSRIGANVELLRKARPDLQVEWTPPNTSTDHLYEQVGAIKIRRPGASLKQWSIFEDLHSLVRVSTNYAAESRIKREVQRRDPESAKRLEWDTEAGAVGCYADTEADIRLVAAIVNDLSREK